MSERSERFTMPSLDGVHLHAILRGNPDAPPLVLLHGGGANAHWWDHLAPSLATRFHVIALDFRGHGDSDHPAETYVGAFNDDLDAVFDHLGLQDAILVGHSMGAHIALDRAAQGPGVRALVLVDVAWGSPPGARKSARRALSMRMTYLTREKAIARFRFLPSASHADDALRHAIASASVREEPDGRWGFKFDPRWFALPYRKPPELSAVQCPVLVLRGEESPFLTSEGVASLAEQLPRAEVVEVPEAGHHLHLDRPERVLAEIEAFLARLD
jgi:pimeloyl-ACP methyl ester carboxylesterase